MTGVSIEAVFIFYIFIFFFFQAEDGRRSLVRSRGLGDVYKKHQQQLERPQQHKTTTATVATTATTATTATAATTATRATTATTATTKHLSLIHIGRCRRPYPLSS